MVCCFPALPGFNAYPAVIGAAIGGMLVATIATVLLFMYVVRNRNNNPRKCGIAGRVLLCTIFCYICVDLIFWSSFANMCWTSFSGLHDLIFGRYVCQTGALFLACEFMNSFYFIQNAIAI